MEFVKKYWLAGDTDSTLKEIRQILAKNKASISSIKNDDLLLVSSVYYQLGYLHQAAELLTEVKFELFNVQQWIVENNLLVLKYLRTESFEDQRTIALSFGSLYERIRGLPFPDVGLLELNVCLNYALVIFCSKSRQALAPGGHNLSQTALLTTLERVCGSTAKLNQGFNESIETKLRDYFKNAREKKQEIFFVSALIWLLSSNYLVNSRVAEAQKLIRIILDFSIRDDSLATQRKLNVIFTFLPNGSNFQDFLTPASHLLLSYAAFTLRDKTLSLRHCESCLNLQPEFISGLFLKGLLLYDSKKYEDSIHYLQRVVNFSNDIGYKATALNILGCVCAKLNKPQTALLKFREAFSSDSGHIESLYNVAVVYHDCGEFELEISMWKYILKILSLHGQHDDFNSSPEMNVDYFCGVSARALDDLISEDRFIIFTDINPVLGNDGRNSKLSIPPVLFKIAHSCFAQNRHSEASEFYGKLFDHLNEKSVDLNECRIPKFSVLYKNFAEALFKSGRWDDCYAVCEKFLTQKTVSKVLSNSSQEEKALIEVMLCKAAVLKELQRPIEANECYESILNTIHNRYDESCARKMNLGEPERKRQKSGKCEFLKQEEVIRLKALTLNDQSLLLSSLGKYKEALLLLTQSISCQPDCLKYRYNHTRLLFDMGQEDEAARDWLKFRRIEELSPEKFDGDISKLKGLPKDDGDTDLYVEMDSRAINRLF
ncbi:uncharacterized protein LOC114537225 [Dendronephthya gigantea]|uniref:uncharacterized protein LOC114537225 n=1 Tax=Dendronephthya gigantea TaxID=151771 RepID=UPI00106B6B86|nr:uncharacterized protein LOC114537225 [Dendronephthya gigantea]